MQRNSKQVLLKYNTVERKTFEDDAFRFNIKTLLRWFFLTTLLFFPFMFYVPYYFEDVPNHKKSVDIVIYGWGLNTSRSIPLYVIPDNDTVLIEGGQLCSEPLLLLIVVCSAVKNTLQRSTIRETWGNYSSPNYKLAFLLGTTDNVTLQETIEEESAEHNDIIQENFIDSYNNLTLKSVMMLKFVKNYCQEVEFIFKSDDDMFTYIPNLLVLIEHLKGRIFSNGNILVGKLICGAKPILEVNNKWYAPKYMFPEKVYPRYLSGTAYLMNRKTALDLYKAALEIPYLHLEDVFITGLCSRKAQITPIHHSGFSYLTRPLDPCLYTHNLNVITSHRVSIENMKQLWIEITNGTKCSKSKKRTFFKLDFLKPTVGKKSRCS